MTKKEKTCAQIADRVSAYRRTHGRNSLQRIYISKPLYRFIAGQKWESVPKERKPTLFGIEVKAFDSDKMEYSFAGATYEVEEVKK